MKDRPTTAEINRRISGRSSGMAYSAIESANTVQQGVAAGVIGAQVSLYSTVLSAVWQMFLLPAAAIFGIISAIISWRMAALNKNEGYGWVKAVVDTVFAAALVAATIGAIVATVAFSVVGPAIYAATIAGKALFNFGSAIYLAFKARHTEDAVLKADYSARAKNALVEGVVGTVISGAIAAITFVASPVAYVASLAMWTIAATVGVFWSVKEYQRQKQDRNAMLEMHVDTGADETPRQSTVLNNVLQLRKSDGQAPAAERSFGSTGKDPETRREERGTSVLQQTGTDQASAPELHQVQSLKTVDISQPPRPRH